MRTFFSHVKYDKEGKVYGSKLLREHIDGVTSRALGAFYDRLSFDTPISFRELLRLLCMYHDLGKYTSYFQNYLTKDGDYTHELKQHAKFGGFLLYQKLMAQGLDRFALLAFYIIEHHHKSLSDLEEVRNFVSEGNNDEYVFRKQVESIRPGMDIVVAETGETELNQLLAYPDKNLRRLAKELTDVRRAAHIENYFLINYLFSLLIESDKLDASDTLPYTRRAVPPTLVDHYLGGTREAFLGSTDFAKLTQNELRNYVRGQVLSHLSDPDILNLRLFTLTAPTGIGKTLTALDFALRLKELIRVHEGGHAQIINALPFINILEQACAVYKNVLRDHAEVLAHYQFADALEQMSGQHDDEENGNYHQKVMLLDTWQSDVVVTTFVQFLQTLIGNRNKLLKKFHHFAGAIVILDEVQTIRLEQLPLVGAALYYASKFLNMRVILMTATKPKTFELAEREILENEGEKTQVRELLTDYDKVFGAFRRTRIITRIAHRVNSAKDFVTEHFAKDWDPGKSCLIVCNVVSRSIEVFKEVKTFLNVDGVVNPVYYLSTNIIPARRLDIIQRIKKDIRDGLKPILVATQCVEAGVDLDFDMGFRDLGPIDSIIQVAGRINRENSPKKVHSPLVVIDFGDCKNIYGQITEAQARAALEGSADASGSITEEHYLDLINNYYDSLADGKKSFHSSRMFFANMKQLNYDNVEKDQYAVSQFQVIENKGFAVSVFIELDSEAEDAKNAFRSMLAGEITREEFDTKFKLAFNQRMVTVPRTLPAVLELLHNGERNRLAEGILLVNFDEWTEFYDEETGFRRTDTEEYTTMI